MNGENLKLDDSE